MTQKEAKKILVTAFKALTKTQRERMLEHVEKKTPIFFGRDSAYFFSKGGAA